MNCKQVIHRDASSKMNRTEELRPGLGKSITPLSSVRLFGVKKIDINVDLSLGHDADADVGLGFRIEEPKRRLRSWSGNSGSKEEGDGEKVGGEGGVGFRRRATSVLTIKSARGTSGWGHSSSIKQWKRRHCGRRVNGSGGGRGRWQSRVGLEAPGWWPAGTGDGNGPV